MRTLLRAAARSLTQDREIRSFDHPLSSSVPFLAKEPKTDEEIAENLWERIRAVGVTADLKPTDIDVNEFMAVKQIREESEARLV